MREVNILNLWQDLSSDLKGIFLRFFVETHQNNKQTHSVFFLSKNPIIIQLQIHFFTKLLLLYNKISPPFSLSQLFCLCLQLLLSPIQTKRKRCRKRCWTGFFSIYQPWTPNWGCARPKDPCARPKWPWPRDSGAGPKDSGAWAKDSGARAKDSGAWETASGAWARARDPWLRAGEE